MITEAANEAGHLLEETSTTVAVVLMMVGTVGIIVAGLLAVAVVW